MLSYAGLNEGFRDKVVYTIYYLINQSPSTYLDLKTLFDFWYISLAYEDLRIFWYHCYTHDNSNNLESRSLNYLSLSYNEDS